MNLLSLTSFPLKNNWYDKGTDEKPSERIQTVKAKKKISQKIDKKLGY